MQKNLPTEIKSFEFSELGGGHVVGGKKVESFSFNTIDGNALKSKKVPDEIIRAERKSEVQNDFKIDATVRELRGLAGQEKSDIDKKINQEVEKGIKEVYHKAIEEGRSIGRDEGTKEIKQNLANETGQALNDFLARLNEVNKHHQDLLEKNRQQIVDFVKKFSKWVILKEVNDKKYLESLMEKLLLELNARKNLIIKVGSSSFQNMPEIIQTMETKFGQLQNIRLEIVPELEYPGIVIESENGLIDGSLEGVFNNIDKIFDQVNSNE